MSATILPGATKSIAKDGVETQCEYCAGDQKRQDKIFKPTGDFKAGFCFYLTWTEAENNPCQPEGAGVKRKAGKENMRTRAAWTEELARGGNKLWYICERVPEEGYPAHVQARENRASRPATAGSGATPVYLQDLFGEGPSDTGSVRRVSAGPSTGLQ